MIFICKPFQKFHFNYHTIRLKITAKKKTTKKQKKPKKKKKNKQTKQTNKQKKKTSYRPFFKIRFFLAISIENMIF